MSNKNRHMQNPGETLDLANRRASASPAVPQSLMGIGSIGPITYEHRSVEIPDLHNMAEFSADGWGLVSVVRAMKADRVVAYFKRPKQ